MINHLQTLPDEPLIRTDFAKGDPISQQEAMLLCFEVAKGGLGQVSPNPIVGCVIVDEDHLFLSSGFHAQYGQAHAEQNALAKLSEEELGKATVYVSLEPCAHHGQTPPCAETLARFKLKRVYFAIEDPNPKVSGKGMKILTAAGIPCERLVGYEDLAWTQNALFLLQQKLQKRLIVGLKAAMSLDAKIAYSGDQRVWISCERSRKLAHHLRLVYDSICIGADTLISDNPELTPRNASYGSKVPWRIVMDPKLRALETVGIENVKLLTTQPEKIIWFIGAEAENHPLTAKLKGKGVSVCPIKYTVSKRLDLSECLHALEAFKIYSLLLEGGAGLYQDFIEQKLVDRLHIFLSPKHFYGSKGRSIFQGEELIERDAFKSHPYICGDDVYIDILN